MFKYIKKTLWIIPGVIFIVSQAFTQSPVWNCRIHTPPNPYIFHKDYLERLLWIDITNSENHTVPVYLHGEIKRNGILIARANSNRINIPQGGKRITRNDIRKLTDEWWDPEIKKILTRSPVLPEGQYVACVYVYRWGTRQLLTKCCISFQSMPMSPPRLISPKDGAKVSTKYPLFQWAPPQPALRGITYELKIVEVYKGQTKEEAMESNPAWFEKKEIRTTSFRYPSSARPFKQGNPYAWQIRGDPGFIDPNLADGLKSEVWSFEVGHISNARVMGKFNLIFVLYRFFISEFSPQEIITRGKHLKKELKARIKSRNGEFYYLEFERYDGTKAIAFVYNGDKKMLEEKINELVDFAVHELIELYKLRNKSPESIEEYLQNRNSGYENCVGDCSPHCTDNKNCICVKVANITELCGADLLQWIFDQLFKI